jgi:hypothetical protein
MESFLTIEAGSQTIPFIVDHIVSVLVAQSSNGSLLFDGQSLRTQKNICETARFKRNDRSHILHMVHRINDHEAEQDRIHCANHSHHGSSNLMERVQSSQANPSANGQHATNRGRGNPGDEYKS